MHVVKRRLIIVRDTQALDTASVKALDERFTGLEYLTVIPPGSVGSEKFQVLPTPDRPIRTSYENYLSDAVYLFLELNHFDQVYFWGCPELAVACLRLHAFGLMRLNTEMRVASSVNDSKAFGGVERAYLAQKAIELSGAKSAASVSDATLFFKDEIKRPSIENFALSDSGSQRITVCIPHSNRWGFIRETLKSFKEQTFTDFDLVVMDD
ncbi:MAG: hypothetical protein V4692_16255, partial [Bdellovibrionota bacterium]